ALHRGADPEILVPSHARRQLHEMAETEAERERGKHDDRETKQTEFDGSPLSANYSFALPSGVSSSAMLKRRTVRLSISTSRKRALRISSLPTASAPMARAPTANAPSASEPSVNVPTAMAGALAALRRIGVTSRSVRILRRLGIAAGPARAPRRKATVRILPPIRLPFSAPTCGSIGISAFTSESFDRPSCAVERIATGRNLFQDWGCHQRSRERTMYNRIAAQSLERISRSKRRAVRHRHDADRASSPIASPCWSIGSICSCSA